MNKKPDCYKCEYRRRLFYDAHSACANKTANVVGDEHGIGNGWFSHPSNFDPVWLVSCDGFKQIEIKSVKKIK